MRTKNTDELIWRQQQADRILKLWSHTTQQIRSQRLQQHIQNNHRPNYQLIRTSGPGKTPDLWSREIRYEKLYRSILGTRLPNEPHIRVRTRLRKTVTDKTLTHQQAQNIFTDWEQSIHQFRHRVGL